MEMQICEKGIIIVLLFAIVSLVVLVIILQVSISLSCKEKIEATLIDLEAIKGKKVTTHVAVPHELRYSKYSYTYKPKKEFKYKEVYTYTYYPIYQYNYNNQCFTRKPLNILDYYENKAFENKKYKIGQKCYLYIDPKRPALCVTKRFSLANTLLFSLCSIGVILFIFMILRTF